MTTYEDFADNYLVKNGMTVNQQNLNKAPDQLKKEIDEVNTSISEIGTLADFQTALES